MQREIRRIGYIAAWILVLGLGAGCGDDDGNANNNANGNGNGNNNNNVEPRPFEVLEVSPQRGDSGVFLDQTLRVTFSQPLDSETVDASSVRVSADGEEAVGRILPDGRVLMFIPVQLKPHADYTITVTGDVQDQSGTPLGQDFTSTFQTGGVTIDGTSPPDPTISAPFRYDLFVRLSRQMEYVLVGADYDGSAQNLFVIDPLEFNQTDPAPTEEVMYAGTDPAFAASERKRGVAGNFDRDPEDEVALLTHPAAGPGALRVLDKSEGAYGLDTLAASLMIGGQLGGAYDYDLAVGDVDLDGYDEIVVVGKNEQGEARLWIFDDRVASFALLTEIPVLGVLEQGSWSGVSAIRVAVGNIGGSRAPEVVIAMQAIACPKLHVAVMENLAQSYEELDVYELPSTGYCSSDTQMVVGVGDLDGDHVEEVLLSTHQLESNGSTYSCTSRYHLDALRRVGASFEILDTVSGEVSNAEGYGLCPGHRPAGPVALSLDIDGDRAAELLLEGQLWQWNEESAELQRMNYDLSLFGAYYTAPVSVAVGDVNGDGLEDVLMCRQDGSVLVSGFNPILLGYDLEMNPIYDYEWGVIDERVGGGPLGQTTHVLVPANLDGDSIIVSPSFVDPSQPATPEGRTVEHRIGFSGDRIIAVLAAPPCYDEDWQNTTDCSTGLGVSSGGTITTGASFSVFAGVSVGVNQDVITALGMGKTAFEFTAKLQVQLDLSVYGSESVGVEQTIGDYAGLGEDLVIFYTVPYHQYIYTFTSHPDPAVLGTQLTVNVPMAPRLFAVSRAYYNANNGSQPDIDRSILAHTPGEPYSYPSFGDVPGILANHAPLGFTAPPVTVNQGSGYKELQLSLSGEATQGDSVALTTSFETEVCVQGFCVGMNLGASVAAFAEASYSSSTVFSSSVGAIDAEHWADHLYEYGLFSYLDFMTNLQGDVTQIFTVVNYYVD